MFQKKKQKLEFEKLESALLSLEKPSLNDGGKHLMKKRLLSKIDGPVASYISRQAENFELDSSTKAKMKERVFGAIESYEDRRRIWRRLFAFQKRIVSGALVVMIVFTTLTFIHPGTNIVLAETFTTLTDFSGEIEIMRDGEVIEAEEGMRIFEKDKLVTGEDSYANIQFFDDSVSRLAENTELTINKLFRPQGSNVKSYVEISVLDGVLWSRVVNLVERSSAFVVESGDVYSSTKRGAFNVEVEDDDVEVKVFNSTVDVRVGNETEKVASGNRASVNPQKSIVISEIDEDNEDEEWVAANLASDKAHVEELGVKIKESREGVDSTLKDKTKILFTFDDVKREKLKLDLAEKEFVSAQVEIEEEGLSVKEKEKIQKKMKNFSTEVEDFYQLVEEVKAIDPKYAAELGRYVEEKILVQKKALSFTMPDSSAYEAKEIVEDLELLTVDDPDEIVGIKTDQAVDKLTDVKEVIERGDDDLAAQVMDEYNKDITDVKEIIDETDDTNVEKEEMTEEVREAVTDAVVEVDETVEEKTDQREIIEEVKPLPPLLSL